MRGQRRRDSLKLAQTNEIVALTATSVFVKDTPIDDGSLLVAQRQAMFQIAIGPELKTVSNNLMGSLCVFICCFPIQKQANGAKRNFPHDEELTVLFAFSWYKISSSAMVFRFPLSQ